jgi:hypothetical protein
LLSGTPGFIQRLSEVIQGAAPQIHNCPRDQVQSVFHLNFQGINDALHQASRDAVRRAAQASVSSTKLFDFLTTISKKRDAEAVGACCSAQE